MDDADVVPRAALQQQSGCAVVVGLVTLLAVALWVKDTVSGWFSDDPRSAATSDNDAPLSYLRTRVSSAKLGDAWPLTVPEGHVRCDRGWLITFERDNVTYALNGLAESRARARRWRRVDEIWRDNPTTPGTKVSLGALIDAGERLCRQLD